MREQRLEVFVADRVRGHPDVGELQKQLLVDVGRDDVFARRRQQRGRLGHGDVDEGAAVGAGAAAAALACAERGDGDGKNDDGREAEAP